MQHVLHVLAIHNRLEEQFELTFDEGLLKPRVPGVMAIAGNSRGTLLKANPPGGRLIFSAGQGLIGKFQ
ncbi:hypothetical protein D3C87_1970640 [compost metagenome]